MATAKGHPAADPHAGLEKFEAHLPRVLAGRSLGELGWRRPTKLSLFVPMVAGPEGADRYLLRLGFECYKEWPPSARFVNPKTLTFDREKDLYWLPKVEGDSGFAVHPNYHDQNYSGQLLCCSYTLEFYLMLHEVKPEYLWDSENYTFGATIHRAQQALRSAHYKGRHSLEAPKDDAA